MTHAIQRLRASRLKTDSDNFRRGQLAGRRWAETQAEWQDLKNLAQTWAEWPHDYLSPENAGFRQVNYGSADSCGAWIVLSMFTSDERMRELGGADWTEVVERTFGVDDEKEVTLEFARGFVHAALEIFGRVRDEVED